MERRILMNHDMDVRETNQPRTVDGDLTVVKLWTLVLTDLQSGTATEITFGREARDELVKRLTGGIVLAGGELPNIRPSV